MNIKTHLSFVFKFANDLNIKKYIAPYPILPYKSKKIKLRYFYKTAAILLQIICPDAYLVYKKEDYKDILPETERQMIEYYVENKSEIPFEEVQQFKSSNGYIYFISLEKDSIQEKGYPDSKGIPLIYVNVSFDSDLVKTTTLILMIAIGIIAISNIMINSIRYSKSHLKIEALRENTIILVRISDDGKWLSENDINYVFDRFYKGSKGQSGIGMALSREYIKIHKRDIVVKLSGGTIFEIILPITYKK